ncbi:terminasae [Pseudoalteromonas phage vB_Pun_Y3]
MIKQYDWAGYTDKERLFCYEYIADPKKNKTNAAINAGYAKNSAQQQSTRIYKKCEDRINEMLSDLTVEHKVTADRIIQEFAKIGFMSAKDFFDSNGRALPINELSDDAAAAIVGMKIIDLEDNDDDRPSIIKEYKLADKLDALTKLGQNLQMFTKKIVIDDKRPKVVVKDMTGRKKREQ